MGHVIGQSDQALIRIMVWDTLRISLLFIYEDVPIHRRGGVRVTSMHCWYLQRGQATIYLDDQTITVNAGQWFVLPQGRLEREFSEDAYVISMNFHARWPDGSNLFSKREHQIISGEMAESLLTAARALLAYVRQVFPVQNFLIFLPEPTSAMEYLKMQRLLLDWIICYIGIQTKLGHPLHTLAPMDERVIRAREYIDQHIFSQSLPEGVIASHVGISVSQLNRLFSEQYGKTPRKYTEDQRLMLVKRMLKGADVSIKQLAFNMGFRQLSHFSSWFRRQTGESPRSFRKRILDSKEYSF